MTIRVLLFLGFLWGIFPQIHAIQPVPESIVIHLKETMEKASDQMRDSLNAFMGELDGNVFLGAKKQGLTEFLEKLNPNQIFIFVKDGKVIASNDPKFQGQPFDFKDVNGNRLLDQFIDALKSGQAEKLVQYEAVESDGSQKSWVALAYSSNVILGQENHTGKKFLCFTAVPLDRNVAIPQGESQKKAAPK